MRTSGSIQFLALANREKSADLSRPSGAASPRLTPDFDRPIFGALRAGNSLINAIHQLEERARVFSDD